MSQSDADADADYSSQMLMLISRARCWCWCWFTRWELWERCEGSASIQISMSISPVSAYCLNLYEVLQFSTTGQRWDEDDTEVILWCVREGFKKSGFFDRVWFPCETKDISCKLRGYFLWVLHLVGVDFATDRQQWWEEGRGVRQHHHPVFNHPPHPS